jgi:hypothetical protein
LAENFGESAARALLKAVRVKRADRMREKEVCMAGRVEVFIGSAERGGCGLPRGRRGAKRQLDGLDF